VRSDGDRESAGDELGDDVVDVAVTLPESWLASL
jgi:hypothetical protein